MPTDPEEEVLVVDVVSDALEPGWEAARLRETVSLGEAHPTVIQQVEAAVQRAVRRVC